MSGSQHTHLWSKEFQKRRHAFEQRMEGDSVFEEEEEESQRRCVCVSEKYGLIVNWCVCTKLLNLYGADAHKSFYAWSILPLKVFATETSKWNQAIKSQSRNHGQGVVTPIGAVVTAATGVKKFWLSFLLLDHLTTLQMGPWPFDRTHLTTLCAIRTCKM